MNKRIFRNIFHLCMVSCVLAVASACEKDKESVSGITVAPSTLRLDVGGTATLTAAVKPADVDQTVAWSSSDNEVATVDDNGVVTAVGRGSAVITAAKGGKNGICTVSVGLEYPARTYLNVAASYNVEGSGATYAAAYTAEQLADPTTVISFSGWGFEVPSVRTARVYASESGTILYNLSYGGGTISKYTVKGGADYDEVKTLDISLAMGTANPRWTKVSEDYALLHTVTTEHKYNASEQYTHTATTAILTAIELGSFSIVTDYHTGGGVKFEMPRSAEDGDTKAYVWRIDAPAIHDGKAYYGLNKRCYDAATDKNISVEYSASSLVVDFPSLNNPRIITSTVGKGSTQGYRTPVAHADEKGDIYQVCGAPSHMLKISGGDYDNSYVFDISSALGIKSVGTNGWFYVGGGIGYLPFYDAEAGSGSSVAAWGVARIDLYGKTAVKLNLPANLWLQQYQMGAIDSNGKFYMAIAPLGGSGNIYIFDPKDTTADGFVKGAKIETMDDKSGYLGVF